MYGTGACNVDNKTQAIEALMAMMDMVLVSCENGRSEGEIYAILMSAGLSFADFGRLMAMLGRMGFIATRAHYVTLTTDGRKALAMARTRLGVTS